MSWPWPNIVKLGYEVGSCFMVLRRLSATATYHNKRTWVTARSSRADEAGICLVYLHAALPRYCSPFPQPATHRWDNTQGKRSFVITKTKERRNVYMSGNISRTGNKDGKNKRSRLSSTSNFQPLPSRSTLTRCGNFQGTPQDFWQLTRHTAVQAGGSHSPITLLKMTFPPNLRGTLVENSCPLIGSKFIELCAYIWVNMLRLHYKTLLCLWMTAGPS